MSRTVIVEADGGSRGNPGPAAYGAVLRDGATGELIAEAADTIGVATNNVAEYRGLIAGLELAAEYAPDAEIEVRMDSKLVVEQMSGNWKIKHPDMKPLALQANRLAPFGTTFTWVPRALNKHADRLVNDALDGKLSLVRPSAVEPASEAEPESVVSPEPESAAEPVAASASRGWSSGTASPTTLILVRHGATVHTEAKRFSGGLAGADPALTDGGRAQMRAVGGWLQPMAREVDALVSSPLRRTRESADILAAFLDRPVEIEDGLAEMEFGSWEGLTYEEVERRFPDELSAWLGDLEYSPGGGESFRSVEKRVLAGRDRLLARYAGRTVVAVTHVTPIKVMVADVLGAPLDSVFRMELAAASVTVLSWFDADGDQRANLRMFNARPTRTSSG
ncbi:MAG TPA: bifunctional RNase H/acid phosphatase [Marmoricola sp.]|nr:bifunctional RNase H/acid phosphatase [Marmoricola sp.]